MNKRKVIGSILFLAGLSLCFISPFANITGFSVAENIEDYFGSWIYVAGLAMMIGGLILFIHSPQHVEEGNLPKIIRTHRFEKAVRRHRSTDIGEDIAKIGTGLGKEERLRGHEGLYSLRVTKGSRLIFSKPNPNEVVLQDYLPAHEYDRIYG